MAARKKKEPAKGSKIKHTRKRPFPTGAMVTQEGRHENIRGIMDRVPKMPPKKKRKAPAKGSTIKSRPGRSPKRKK